MTRNTRSSAIATLREAHHSAHKATIVALVPFLAIGDLTVAIMRALLARRGGVAIAFCSKECGCYIADPMEDFAAEGRLIDLSSMHPRHYHDYLRREFAARGTRLVLQIGADSAYPALPRLKESDPSLKLVDILHDEIGHTRDHFLYQNCFDGVIVESEYMRRFVERGTLTRGRNIRIIEGGVDLNYFTPGARVSAPGCLQVGYVGDMSAENDPISFIDLAERLATRLPGVQFSMVGEGSLSEDVERRIVASPMQDWLQHRRCIPEVRNALRALDVLIVPSRLDVRTNVIMEASACGVPVIASPVGSIPELINEGCNGLLASPDDVDRIAEILRAWLLDYSVALAAMRQSCRAVAEARFDRNRMLDGYSAIFEDLVRSEPTC
jgi:glycosyltransferase involved in cell wall biosynthesis